MEQGRARRLPPASGLYWGSILVGGSAAAPVLSVLGNSTRSGPGILSVSSGLAGALRSRGDAGRLSRDVAAGLAPEGDDCAEAEEHCRELADAYEPPGGGGGEDDDADAYFDED